MKLNTIEISFKGILHTLLKFILCLFNIFKSHLLWNCKLFTTVFWWILDCYCRWCHWNISLHFLGMRYSSTMKQLDEYFPSFWVNWIYNFLPSWHLFLVIKARCPYKTISFDGPGSSLSEDDSSSRSLRIILSNKLVRLTSRWMTSLPSESSHKNPIFDLQLSKKDLITPIFMIHDIYKIIY